MKVSGVLLRVLRRRTAFAIVVCSLYSFRTAHNAELRCNVCGIHRYTIVRYIVDVVATHSTALQHSRFLFIYNITLFQHIMHNMNGFRVLYVM